MSDDEHTPDDPLPGLIAEIDQMIQNAPHLARAIRGIYESLVAEGFADKQALYLTAAQIHSDPGRPPA